MGGRAVIRANRLQAFCSSYVTRSTVRVTARQAAVVTYTSTATKPAFTTATSSVLRTQTLVQEQVAYVLSMTTATRTNTVYYTQPAVTYVLSTYILIVSQCDRSVINSVNILRTTSTVESVLGMLQGDNRHYSQLKSEQCTIHRS